jgi:ubiquinone/menaquinone biosynthesis C-methylase UbiE
LIGLAAGTALDVGRWLWQRLHGANQQRVAFPNQPQHLLERARPLLQLPTSPDKPPEVLADGSGLRCPITEQVWPYRRGILHLLEEESERALIQRVLDTPVTAWTYDHFRDWITKALAAPDFPIEVAHIQRALQAQPGDVVLDLACGQGNFTVEWAKRVGPTGLVIGLDISLAMLERAAYHVSRWELDNVLLIHADAQALPFADGTFTKINCSGGFHQIPDLPQALREAARVSAAGAVLTASTFAERPADPHTKIKGWLHRHLDLHFVPTEWLDEQLTRSGYGAHGWSLPGGWFGYTSAQRKEGRS